MSRGREPPDDRASFGSAHNEDEMPNFADIAAPSLANFSVEARTAEPNLGGYEPNTVYYPAVDAIETTSREGSAKEGSSDNEDDDGDSSLPPPPLPPTIPIKARLHNVMPPISDLPEAVRSLLAIKRQSDIARMGIVHFAFATMSKDSELREGGSLTSPLLSPRGQSPAKKRFGSVITSTLKGVVTGDGGNLNKKRKRVLVVCTYSSVYMCDAQTGKVVRFLPYTDITGLSLAQDTAPLSEEGTGGGVLSGTSGALSMVFQIEDEEDAVVHFASPSASDLITSSSSFSLKKHAAVSADNISGGALKWFGLPAEPSDPVPSSWTAVQSGTLVGRVVEGMSNTLTKMQQTLSTHNNSNSSVQAASDESLLQSISASLVGGNNPTAAPNPYVLSIPNNNSSFGSANSAGDSNTQKSHVVSEHEVTSVAANNTPAVAHDGGGPSCSLPRTLHVSHVTTPPGLSPAVFLLQQRAVSKQQNLLTNSSIHQDPLATTMGKKESSSAADSSSPAGGGAKSPSGSSSSKKAKEKMKEKMSRASTIMAASSSTSATAAMIPSSPSSPSLKTGGGAKENNNKGKSSNDLKKKDISGGGDNKSEKKNSSPSKLGATPSMSAAEIALALATGMPVPASAMSHRQQESSDDDDDAMKEFYRHQSKHDIDREKKKDQKKKDREAALIKESETKRQEVMKAATSALKDLARNVEPNEMNQIRTLEAKEKREINEEERKIRRRQRRIAAGWTLEMVNTEEEKLVLEARTKRNLKQGKHDGNGGDSNQGVDNDVSDEVDSDTDAARVMAEAADAGKHHRNDDTTPTPASASAPTGNSFHSSGAGIDTLEEDDEKVTATINVNTTTTDPLSIPPSQTEAAALTNTAATAIANVPTVVSVEPSLASSSSEGSPLVVNESEHKQPASQAVVGSETTSASDKAKRDISDGVVHHQPVPDIRDHIVGEPPGEDIAHRTSSTTIIISPSVASVAPAQRHVEEREEETQEPPTEPSSTRSHTRSTALSQEDMMALEQRLTASVKENSVAEVREVFNQILELKQQQVDGSRDLSQLRDELRTFTEQASKSLSAAVEAASTASAAAAAAVASSSVPGGERREDKQPSTVSSSEDPTIMTALLERQQEAIVALEANMEDMSEKNHSMLIESEGRIEKMLAGLFSKLEGQQSAQIGSLQRVMDETLKRVESRVESLEITKSPQHDTEVALQRAAQAISAPPPPPLPSAIPPANIVPLTTTTTTTATAKPQSVTSTFLWNDDNGRSVAPMTGRSPSPDRRPTPAAHPLPPPVVSSEPSPHREQEAQSSPSSTTRPPSEHRGSEDRHSASLARIAEEEKAKAAAVIEDLQNKLHTLEQRHRVESARGRELEASYAELRASVATERRNATTDVEQLLRTQQAFYERQMVEQQDRVAKLKSEAISTNRVLREVSDDFALSNMRRRSQDGFAHTSPNFAPPPASPHNQQHNNVSIQQQHQRQHHDASPPSAVSSQPMPPVVGEDEALESLQRQYPHLFSSSPSSPPPSTRLHHNFNVRDHPISPYRVNQNNGDSTFSLPGAGNRNYSQYSISSPGRSYSYIDASPYRHIATNSSSYNSGVKQQQHHQQGNYYSPFQSTSPQQHQQQRLTGSIVSSELVAAPPPSSFPPPPTTMSQDALSVLQALQRRKAMRNDI